MLCKLLTAAEVCSPFVAGESSLLFDVAVVRVVLSVAVLPDVLFFFMFHM